MSSEPPFDRQSYDQDNNQYDDHYPRRKRLSLLLLLAIGMFAIASFYSSMVVVTRADEIFFPGNELVVPIGFDSVPGVAENPPAAAESIEDRINIVVLGLDQRRDEADAQGYRTDSVMVVTIDPYSKTGGIFSIPRDTRVEIPNGVGGYYEDRINVVYESEDTPEEGAQLVKDTIEHNFGIPINYYVVLNFNNFIDLINELGGIDVDIPSYAYDPAYNDCNYCDYYSVEFVPGLEHMDGERALAYSRIRQSDNDYKRIERQQVVVRAVAHRAQDLGTVLDDPVGFYNKFKDAVKTDVSEFKLPGLALLGKEMGIDSIPMVSMGPATYPCPAAECGGAAELNWDEDEVAELLATVFSDGRLQGDNAIVDLKNGTTTPDLAGEFAGYLRGQGLPAERITVDEYANGELYNITLIYDLSGKPYTSQKLADWLGVPYTRIKSIADPEAAHWREVSPASDVVVLIGSDAIVPGLYEEDSSVFTQ